jgi:UDP-N-acetylglucosamine--N-acetylmuramyl-(pentapeptide) pyrophosphoryl-undecaprenol N-acetylglucosamine transferase
MGGSQGAHGINELILKSMELLARRGPDWQWVHLAGPADVQALTKGYCNAGLAAKVYSFFPEVELAMGAATAAVSRAGASSLAELAAMRLPSVLVPFPAATDNHQFHNARAFEQTGAARLVEQRTAHPEDFVKCFGDLMCAEESRRTMREALARWHKPHAAEEIARAVLDSILSRRESTGNVLRPSKSRKNTEPGKSSRSQDQGLLSATTQPVTLA